jgi:hypothetical protein
MILLLVIIAKQLIIFAYNEKKGARFLYVLVYTTKGMFLLLLRMNIRKL